MLEPLRVFVGYDEKESAAFHVAAHGIVSRASRPVSVIPIVQRHLKGIYARERGPLESTAFSFTRFLTPYLCGYQGYAIFMDCDMAVRCDVHDLLLYPLAHPDKAVFVVKHDYTPKAESKMGGLQQTAYPRKNWSSLMVFNNARCSVLTPQYVNEATGLDLHRFLWLPDEQIGDLPNTYNWLVSEYPQRSDAKILHFTLGVPTVHPEAPLDHFQDWLDERAAMLGGRC